MIMQEWKIYTIVNSNKKDRLSSTIKLIRRKNSVFSEFERAMNDDECHNIVWLDNTILKVLSKCTFSIKFWVAEEKIPSEHVRKE